MEKHANPQLEILASHLIVGSNPAVLLSIQLPAKCQGKQWELSQGSGPLHSLGDLQEILWFTDLNQRSSGHCGHFGRSKPVGRRSIFPFLSPPSFVCSYDFQVN